MLEYINGCSHQQQRTQITETEWDISRASRLPISFFGSMQSIGMAMSQQWWREESPTLLGNPS